MNSSNAIEVPEEVIQHCITYWNGQYTKTIRETLDKIIKIAYNYGIQHSIIEENLETDLNDDEI